MTAEYQKRPVALQRCIQTRILGITSAPYRTARELRASPSASF